MRPTLFLLALSAMCNGAVVFQQDFEAGIGSGFSGAGTVQSSGGLSAFGFGQQHLKNDGSASTVLTLNGLAPHTSLTLTFDLAQWDSIDLGSDTFQVRIDGTFVYDGTFGNFGFIQGPAGSTMITPNADVNYGYGFWRDSAHALSYTVAHTGATVVIDWTYPNTQGGSDESFGIDNIVVSTNADVAAVPEPSTMMMLGLGAGLVGIRRLQRRT